MAFCIQRCWNDPRGWKLNLFVLISTSRSNFIDLSIAWFNESFVFFCECLTARCGLTLINSQVLELLVFQVFGNDSPDLSKAVFELVHKSYLVWQLFGPQSHERSLLPWLFRLTAISSLFFKYIYIYVLTLVSLSLIWAPHFWRVLFGKTKVWFKWIFYGERITV